MPGWTTPTGSVSGSNGPTEVPVSVAQGGSGSATAGGARTAFGLVIGTDVASQAAVAAAVTRDSWTSPVFAPAAADTIRAYFSPPFAGAEVKAITVGARGAAPTAGTVAFTNGIADGGATLLSAASFALAGLTANTLSAMALSGTLADLRGGLTDGFLMTVTNNNGTIFATVAWGPQ